MEHFATPSTSRGRLKTVEEIDDDPAPAPQSLTRDTDEGASMRAAATSLMLLSLKTLSQKTIVALSALFTLLTAASVFAIAFVISASPSVLQLVLLGLYGVFVLLLEFVRRR